MTNFKASAPGKLFITGEYAVLDHGPALLTAVDVRAHCRMWPSEDGVCRVQATPIAASPCVFRMTGEALQWNGEAMGLVDAAWQALAPARREQLASRGWNITLDTSAFFLKDLKLGLGSSSAALAALSGALWSATGGMPSEPDAFATLKAAHDAWQGGGSGADLAVALAGGTILYRREPRVAAPVSLPDGVDILPIWSGASASTARFLERLAEFERRDPETFRLRFSVLNRAAEEAAVAISEADADVLREAFRSLGGALRALGSAAELPIWSAAHESIGAAVEAAGGVYKPSGAGGGDIGLAMVPRDDKTLSERVKSAVSSAGYRVLPLRFGARGLTVSEG